MVCGQTPPAVSVADQEWRCPVELSLALGPFFQKEDVHPLYSAIDRLADRTDRPPVLGARAGSSPHPTR